MKIYAHFTPSVRKLLVKTMDEFNKTLENTGISTHINLYGKEAYVKTRTLVHNGARAWELKAARAKEDYKVNPLDTEEELKILDDSDVVVVWVPEFRATGYLGIVGYALGKGKPLYVFGNLERFEFSTMLCKHCNVRTSKEFDVEILKEIYAEFNKI